MEIKAESTAAAELKAQLEIELKNKRQCAYTSYECTQLSIDGYKFCYKHILQDKNAPYKQCAYVYSTNGKRCQLPAPRSEKKDYGYCNEHALKATLSRTKQNAKCTPPNTAEVLLCSLSHYIKKPKGRAISNSKQVAEERTGSEDSLDLRNVKYLDPFVDLDAVSIDNGQGNDVLDFGSESESDIEPSTLASVWQDAHGESSGDESADSENEDLLKYANVYTAEEITLITRDKLLRLQALYVEQYRYLQHLLKEKRRKYLHALKREKETCCNIYNQLRDNPKEQRLYRKLKALNNYHKPHGIDAILNKRVHDIRTRIIDGSSSKGSNTKCMFTEGGVKCGERALPLARHCKKHILEDSTQVLFKPCGKVNGDIECNTPVAAIFDESYCQLHMEIPPLRSYSQVRKDSESDLDDSTENHTPYPQFMENIKTEYMHYDIPPDIPKMETLPSILFEESSQSMTSDCGQPNESMYETHLSQDKRDDKDMELEPQYPGNDQLPSSSLELAAGHSLDRLRTNNGKNEFGNEQNVFLENRDIKMETDSQTDMKDLQKDNVDIEVCPQDSVKITPEGNAGEIKTEDVSASENVKDNNAAVNTECASIIDTQNNELMTNELVTTDNEVVDQPMEI